MASKAITLFFALLFISAGLWMVGCGDDDSSGTDPDGDAAADGDTQIPTDGDGQEPTDGDAETPMDGDTPADGDIVIDVPDGDDEGPQPECLTDRDCAGDEYCDTDFQVCRRRKRLCEPCTDSKECGNDGDGCLPGGYCGHWCGSGYTCPNNYECQSVEGFTDKQCVFDMSLDSGDVGDNCCINENCAPPLVCNHLTGKCNPGCTGTSACPPGQICFDDETDDRDGFCTDGCLINEDCSAGEVCYLGECVVGDCADKSDCPIEYKCNTSTFSCYFGCDNDGDCYGRNECIGGVCVERVGCEGTWQCSLMQMCQVELPDGDPEDRGCCFDPRYESTGECNNNNPQGPQPFCQVCTEATSDNTECGPEGKCLEYQDPETEEVIGNFCTIKWDCTVRDEDGLHEGTQECPRGYSCTNIKEGELAGKWCIADCTREEFASR